MSTRRTLTTKFIYKLRGFQKLYAKKTTRLGQWVPSIVTRPNMIPP